MGEARRRHEAGTQPPHRISTDDLACVVAIMTHESGQAAVVYTNVPYPTGNWRRPLTELLGEHEPAVLGYCHSALDDFVARGRPRSLIMGFPATHSIPTDSDRLYEWSRRHVTIALRPKQSGDFDLGVVRGARLANSADMEMLVADDLPSDRRRYLPEGSMPFFQMGNRNNLDRQAARVAADGFAKFCSRTLAHDTAGAHLVVSGYNNDQREVWEIPEVRRYFTMFAAEMDKVDPRGVFLDRLDDMSKGLLVACGVEAVQERDRWQ